MTGVSWAVALSCLLPLKYCRCRPYQTPVNKPVSLQLLPAGAGVVKTANTNTAATFCLQAIYAHFLWLSHLLETWAVVSRLRDGRTAAARAVYGRLLAASLQDPAVLSHHPAAVGAYFRLLTLGLVYGRSCLGAAGSGPGRGHDVLLLFDRILCAVSND
jgi:hypothetical protein